jgi:hypothetical protein
MGRRRLAVLPVAGTRVLPESAWLTILWKK